MIPEIPAPAEQAPAPRKISTRTDLAAAWTRNDTARWLNERSAGLLAYVRRVRPERAPSHSKAMGRWVLDAEPAIFNRAHARLGAAKTNEVRDKLNLIGVVS
jgi:hypothetical protein